MGRTAVAVRSAGLAALALGWAGRAVWALTDVPDQLYSLYTLGKTLTAVSDHLPSPAPSVLTSRLAGADFSTLTPALQRALLWDLGLVFTGDYKALVQVKTVCGQPMSSIFLDVEVVELAADCDLVVCNARSVNFAYPNCSTESVASIARCAVDATDALSTITDNPIWSEDGKIDAVSSYQIFRFEGDASDSSTSSSSSSSSNASSTTAIYTINEQPGISMVDELSCPNQATFVVPCLVLTSDDTESVSESSWCEPVNGVLVDLWLAQEVAALTEGKASEKWMSVAIVFISATGVLIISLVGMAARYYSIKKKAKTTSQLSSELSPSSQPDGVQYAFLSTGVPPSADADNKKANRARLHSRKSRLESKSASMSPTSSTSGDVQSANSEICRRSQALSAFCDDKELLLKKISYRSLRFDKMIAKGANGEVWRGEYAHQEVAIKRLLVEMREDIRCVEYFAKEIHLASILEHPNIVRFIGVSWRLLPELSMVSEFLPHGDLAHYLASPASKQLTWKNEKISLATDIANALVYLHSLVPVIIHRDLKSLNVLLSDAYEAKLSDFGLSRERTFEETMTSGVGTLLWSAPEILRGDRYSEKADIYSYGVVLSELDTCLPPYKLNEELARGKTKSFELLPMIRNGRISPKFTDGVPPSVLTLAQLCLDQNPDRRPNAMQIVYILQSKVQPTL
jgi:mitogen-activated protein kinase kinase kinase 7